MAQGLDLGAWGVVSLGSRGESSGRTWTIQQQPRAPTRDDVRQNQRAYEVLCDVPADCFNLFHNVSRGCPPCCRIWGIRDQTLRTSTI